MLWIWVVLGRLFSFGLLKNILFDLICILFIYFQRVNSSYSRLFWSWNISIKGKSCTYACVLGNLSFRFQMSICFYYLCSLNAFWHSQMFWKLWMRKIKPNWLSGSYTLVWNPALKCHQWATFWNHNPVCQEAF